MNQHIPNPGEPSNPYLARLNLVQGNITEQEVDAIVSTIPQNLVYRGGINAAILTAAGSQVDEFVLEHIYRPRPGDVYAVPGFDLPCDHILFGVVPHRRSAFDRADRDLLTVVRKAMETARMMSLSSIAFPPLGSGRNGFPLSRAARLILQAIFERMDESITEVRIVCPDEKTLKIFQNRLAAYK